MPSRETYIDPNTTKQLLSNLDLAIDEAKLVLKITALNDQLYDLKASVQGSKREASIRNEKRVLELQLNIVRERVAIRMEA